FEIRRACAHRSGPQRLRARRCRPFPLRRRHGVRPTGIVPHQQRHGCAVAIGNLWRGPATRGGAGGPPRRLAAHSVGMAKLMMTKGFAVFDGDSHVVEPPELWEKYLEQAYRTLGKHALWRQEGRTGSYQKINGEI